MPELAEFHAPSASNSDRNEGPQVLGRYPTGMPTEHPSKDCDTLAQVVPGTSEQHLRGLSTAMLRDEDDRNGQRVRRMLELPTDGDAVLIFDETGFAKPGRCSIGVARQHSGAPGEVGNCQITVNCHYSEHTLAWPVATRPCLHESWAGDRERCKRARSC